ncbi:MAG TPA: hypothetical protein VFW98_03075 [Gemmatimonadaceae bacterium]|nr:hypothetical protein [Gemmatimonadaceae bacterium]
MMLPTSVRPSAGSTLAVSPAKWQFGATDPPSMFIETRTLGRKARPLDGWAIPDPPIDRDGEGNRLTLRALITRVVRAEVAAFEHRERARRFVRVLSDAEIIDGSTRGRVDPGGRPATGPVDVEQAVGAALRGFEDGLYLIILDGVEQRELEREVFITPDSKLVFLRLTFLAGA